MTERPDPAAVAEHLRLVLAEVDAGRIEATSTTRAYLAGAIDTAERLRTTELSSHGITDVRND